MTFRAQHAASLLLATLFTSACGAQTLIVQTRNDLTHARIGVLTGSVGESLAHEQFPEAEIQSFDDIMDAVGSLKARHVDAVITAYTTAFQVVKKNPELAVLPDELTDEASSIGVAQGNPELLRAIDQILAEFTADGTLAEMRERWVKFDLSPYEVVSIPMPTAGTPLRVGTAATREPMQFVQNGQYIGHDRELLERIGARLGRPVEFVDMKFGALVAALRSGRIDLIGGSILGTPERRQSIDFSEPYFLNPQILLVQGATGGLEAPDGSFLSRVIASFENNIIQEQRYRCCGTG